MIIPALGAIGGAVLSNTVNMIGADPTQASRIASGSENASFASLLKTLGAETANTIHQGEAAAFGGIAGKLPIHQVGDELMAAERSLQTAISVRDKAVQAYRDIINMAI